MPFDSSFELLPAGEAEPFEVELDCATACAVSVTSDAANKLENIFLFIIYPDKKQLDHPSNDQKRIFLHRADATITSARLSTLSTSEVKKTYGHAAYFGEIDETRS